MAVLCVSRDPRGWTPHRGGVCFREKIFDKIKVWRDDAIFQIVALPNMRWLAAHPLTLADYQVCDGNGTLIIIKAGTTGGGETLPNSNPAVSYGNSLFTPAKPGLVQPVAPAPDVRPASAATITIVDFQDPPARSGTPTANSVAALTLDGQTSALIEVTGTWAGTLEIDGGQNWVSSAR